MARRTGYGRKRFVHFLELRPVRDRFIAELVSEGRPRCVVDAFCHLGSGKFCRRHVADSNQIEPADQVKRRFMLEVGPRVRHFGMQLRDMALMLTRTLRLGKLFRRPLTVAIIRQRLAVGQLGEVFQTKIDADCSCDRPGRNIGRFKSRPLSGTQPSVRLPR